jgi:hypothetical protein
MHLHLVRVAKQPIELQRQAKVVQLEARRQARREAALRERSRPRPAA